MDGYKAPSTSEMIIQCIWIYHVTTIHVFPELVAWNGSQFENQLSYEPKSWWIHCFMTLRMGIESFQLQKGLKYRFLSFFSSVSICFQCGEWGWTLIFPVVKSCFFPLSSLAYAISQDVLLPQPDNRSRWSWLYRSSGKTWLENPSNIRWVVAKSGTSWYCRCKVGPPSYKMVYKPH